MKTYKKITSLLVAFSMVFALMNFTVASATNDPNDVKIEFTTNYILNKDAETVEVGINVTLENTTKFGAVNATLKYDSDVIVPVPWWAAGNASEIYDEHYDTTNATDWNSNILIGTQSPAEYSASAGYVFNKNVAGDNTGYLNLYAEAQQPQTFKVAKTRVITARFALVPGKTVADVNEHTIAFAEDAELTAHSTSSVEYSTGGETYFYNDTLGTAPAKSLLSAANITFAKPTASGTANNGGPADPNAFVSLNIHDWEDEKLSIIIVPKGKDASYLMPVMPNKPGYNFVGWTTRMIPKVDAQGRPVLGEDGKPIMVRNQSTPHVTVDTAPGAKYPAEKLLDVSKITENMDLIPAYDENANVIGSSQNDFRYTITGRTPFETADQDLKTTILIEREAHTRRINYNNGTLVLKASYNTNGKGPVIVFIEGNASDQQGVEIIVSRDAILNYDDDAVTLTVLDYRTNKSRVFSIPKAECVVGK